MNLTPYYEKALFARTLDDEAQFAAMTEHLDLREDLTPYHCGAHSLRFMRTAYEMCGRPKSVLEVGFCMGHSASVWFGLGATRVVALDNSTRQQTLDAGRIMKQRHGDRFSLLLTTSLNLAVYEFGGSFDMMFIDGGHEVDDVSNDIALGLRLKIPYLILDDWFPKWGPGVQPAIERHRLIPIAIIGNLALCVSPEGWKH